MKFLVVIESQTPTATVLAETPGFTHGTFAGALKQNPAIYCSAIDWDKPTQGFAQLQIVANPQAPESLPPMRVVVPHKCIAFVIQDPKGPNPGQPQKEPADAIPVPTTRH